MTIIMNLILYRRYLRIFQINYSFDAPFPNARCNVTGSPAASLSNLPTRLMPVKGSAHQLKEFPIWFMKVSPQFFK